jgi:hypothetical protein
VLFAGAVQAASGPEVPLKDTRPPRANVAPPYSATHFPDWSGVWAKIRSDEVPVDEDTKGVGTRAPSPISYQPEYAARYEALQEKVRQGIPISLPATECLPLGMPYMLYTLYPMQVMMTPGMVTMITEYGGFHRNIHIDRPMPEDTPPSYAGYSRGHWEGDTLVVKTIGLRGDTPIDANGLPHSEELTLTERYREVSPGRLEVSVTMDDPKAFKKPYTRVTQWRFEPDWVINEYVCLENNRNPVDAEGNTHAVLKPQAKP